MGLFGWGYRQAAVDDTYFDLDEAERDGSGIGRPLTCGPVVRGSETVTVQVLMGSIGTARRALRPTSSTTATAAAANRAPHPAVD
jgi:hypothetical protein